jgi:hypothetical protein
VRRVQIYVNDRQDARLASRAAAEGVTKSALVRRAIDAYLDADERISLERFHSAIDAVAGIAPGLPSGAVYVEQLRTRGLERDGAAARRSGWYSGLRRDDPDRRPEP